MLMTLCPFMGTSFVANPTPLTTSVAFEGAENEKVPSLLVEAPVLLPLTTTLMPGRGCPSESVTFPETDTSCALAKMHSRRNEKRNRSVLRPFITQFF